MNKRRGLRILAYLIMLVSIVFLKTEAYASSQDGKNTGVGQGNVTGGPSIHRTGWLYYLVDTQTHQQVGKTVGMTCNTTGDGNGDGFKSIIKESGTKNLLKSNFGVSLSVSDVDIGNRPRHDNPTDYTKGDGLRPPYGYPFGYTSGTVLGYGDEVKKYFDSKETRKYKSEKTHKRSAWVVKDTWDTEMAVKFLNGEVALFFEPFYWFKISDNGNWICGTSHSISEYLKSSTYSWFSHSMIHRSFPYGVMFEKGKSVCGVSIPHDIGTPALRSNDTLAKKSVGLGIGAYWNTLVKSINTYNGKDSPGNTEDPTKDKSKQGKTVIYKRYWEKKVDEKGETVYEKVKDYKRKNTTYNIIITDEKDKGANYRIIGWFTGKNTKDPQPTEDETQEK